MIGGQPRRKKKVPPREKIVKKKKRERMKIERKKDNPRGEHRGVEITRNSRRKAPPTKDLR